MLLRTFEGLVYSRGNKNLFQAASEETESNGQEDGDGEERSGTRDTEPDSAGLFHSGIVFR